MFMKNKNLLFLYLILCVTEIISEYFELRILRYCIKPLLMTVLSIYFYREAKLNYNSFAKKIQAAILFSLFGDVFLMFPNCFLPGLVSFLIAHVFYILAFYENIKASSAKRSFSTSLLMVSPFLLYSGILFSTCYTWLGEMIVPVAVYTSVITFMGMAAVLRKDNVINESFKLVLSGAVIFIVSDSTIALNKFVYHDELPYARIIIMFTYLLAQYLIVSGCLKHLASQETGR